MDEAGLLHEKLDPILRNIVAQKNMKVVPVIIQTADGLTDQDRKTVASLGGTIKDDLYIISAYSAELPVEAVATLAAALRIRKIYFDAEVRAI